MFLPVRLFQPSRSLRLPSQRPSLIDIARTNFPRQVSSKADSGEGSMKYIYVHPLSQIVLECLQSNYSEWLVRRQLDSNSLSFHRDGSFEIKFPTDNESRIWTSFDEEEKKHWLTVQQRGGGMKRYLLQDNLMPNWNRGRGSLPERIQRDVSEMVEEIELFEQRNKYK